MSLHWLNRSLEKRTKLHVIEAFLRREGPPEHKEFKYIDAMFNIRVSSRNLVEKETPEGTRQFYRYLLFREPSYENDPSTGELKCRLESTVLIPKLLFDLSKDEVELLESGMWDNYKSILEAIKCELTLM